MMADASYDQEFDSGRDFTDERTPCTDSDVGIRPRAHRTTYLGWWRPSHVGSIQGRLWSPRCFILTYNSPRPFLREFVKCVSRRQSTGLPPMDGLTSSSPLRQRLPPIRTSSISSRGWWTAWHSGDPGFAARCKQHGAICPPAALPSEFPTKIKRIFCVRVSAPLGTFRRSDGDRQQ